MCNKIDTEELMIELFEMGISIDIKENNGIIVELINKKDTNVIAVVKADTIEKALSTIIRRLTDDSKNYKEVINSYKGLSNL